MSDYTHYKTYTVWSLTKSFFKLLFSLLLAVFALFALLRMTKVVIWVVTFFATLYVIKNLEHALGNYEETRWIGKNVCGIPADQWCHDEALSIIRRDNITIISPDQLVQNTDLFNLLQKATALRLEQKQQENDRYAAIANKAKINSERAECKAE